METYYREKIISVVKFLEIIDSGEWAVGEYASIERPKKVVRTGANSADIWYEYENVPGITQKQTFCLAAGEILIEATLDRIRILQLGTRREQVSKEEGGGWRDVPHHFVRARIVHLPTWDARNTASRERQERERQEERERRSIAAEIYQAAVTREEKVRQEQVAAQMASLNAALAGTGASVGFADDTLTMTFSNGFKMEVTSVAGCSEYGEWLRVNGIDLK